MRGTVSESHLSSSLACPPTSFPNPIGYNATMVTGAAFPIQKADNTLEAGTEKDSDRKHRSVDDFGGKAPLRGPSIAGLLREGERGRETKSQLL